MCQRDMRGSQLPNRAGEAPGVDSADADATPARQPVRKRTGGPPVGRRCRIPLDDETFGHRVCGFFILGVDADVADMRKREDHDLPGIGRIGHDFLVACHCRVEAQLCHSRPGRAESLTPKNRSVGQGKAGGWGLGGVRHWVPWR